MEIYRHVIEQLAVENGKLLRMLDIPVLGAAPRLTQAQLDRDGAALIQQLADRNEALRERLAARSPGIRIETYLGC